MPTPLRVLIVEDNADDAELMVLHLRQAGFEPDWRRVETEADYLAALERPPGPDPVRLEPAALQRRARPAAAERPRPGHPLHHCLRQHRRRGGHRRAAQWGGRLCPEGSAGEAGPVGGPRPGRSRAAHVQQQAERALRESEERYRSLFNGSPVGVYRTGEDGRIQAANPALAELFGFESPDELVGLNARDFYVNPEEQRSWREAVERADVLHDFEIQMRRKDGAGDLGARQRPHRARRVRPADPLRGNALGCHRAQAGGAGAARRRGALPRSGGEHPRADLHARHPRASSCHSTAAPQS